MVTLRYQERFKTAQGVFDEFTHRNLFELHSRGTFDDLVSPVKVGKESNVFLAVKGTKKLIVKIYRVQNCDFRTMFAYIQKDPRYEFLKQKRREIIFSWTQREYKNLFKAQKANVLAPVPLAWKYNILVETMIGDEQPAPMLKDAHPREPPEFLELVVEEMKKLYQGGLIHGDLSAFNILHHQEKPYLIDFSQATLTKTPNAEELLERDVKNVIKFFRKLGAIADFEGMFNKITAKKG